MTAAPKVSVIVPCYNLGQYLDEAIESVLSQTCHDVEIVIVDDGSTEPATQALLANCQWPRTRVLTMPHSGLAAARNLGISQSTGEFLCALDADDRLDPSYLAKAVRVLDTDPSVTFVSAWLSTFGDENWEWTPQGCGLPELLWEDTVLTAAVVRRSAVVASRRLRHRNARSGRRGLGPLVDAGGARSSRRHPPGGALQLSPSSGLDEHDLLAWSRSPAADAVSSRQARSNCTRHTSPMSCCIRMPEQRSCCVATTSSSNALLPSWNPQLAARREELAQTTVASRSREPRE